MYGSDLTGTHVGTESGFGSWKSNKGNSRVRLSAFSLRFHEPPAVSGDGESHWRRGVGMMRALSATAGTCTCAALASEHLRIQKPPVVRTFVLNQEINE